MDIQQIINLLEKLKPEHYSEPSGIYSCLSIHHPDIECDCGAYKLIQEVDDFIEKLEKYKLVEETDWNRFFSPYKEYILTGKIK